MRSTIVLAMSFAVVAAIVGCGAKTDEPTVENEPSFEEQLLRAAGEYENWGRVDEHLNTSLVDCRAPSPARAHFSSSSDPDTHGRKLYTVFARQRSGYYVIPDGTAKIGQILVKESWTAEATTEVAPNTWYDHEKVVRTKGGNSFFPYSTKDGKVYKAAKPAGLFVMMKLDPKTPNTDEGWVYGTVTADGTTVTSSGRVESCMKCHQDAKQDRQFGMRTQE
jgi:hypothetical protein